MDSVKASLFVASSGFYSHDTGSHTMEHILNRVNVSYLPCSIKTFVLIKLQPLFPEYEEEGYLDVYAPDGKIDMNSSLFPIKNYRPQYMFPGGDTSIQVNYPIVQEGNYIYKMCIHGQVIAEYPLYIGLDRNE